MSADDVPAVLATQEQAAVVGLADIFPQDLYPFPREVIAERWRSELREPDVDCFVITRDGAVAGFAARRDHEVMHFGVALEEWGTGLAVAAHHELVRLRLPAGDAPLWLRVYAGNARGRAFWEKLGWRATGERTRSELPPYAELLTYALDRHIDRDPS